MNKIQTSEVEQSLSRFTGWLEKFGETSYDHQSYFASDLGRSAKALYYKSPKLGTIAVAPMIFSEAFIPSARRLFWKPQRFPIADAHYAMGFAFLAQTYNHEACLKRAVHFLDVLKATRTPGCRHYCWGYPFNWETRTGTYKAGTPMITSVPYMYAKVAARNLNFVLESQNPNGSWYYSMDNVRDFVDHFHTCFVLKALAKIEQLTGSAQCSSAIQRGVEYYVKNLFDAGGLPKPFSKAPRLTVYRRELYDYAECINVCVLLQGRFPELDRILVLVLNDVLKRWQKSDGAFRARELLFGWDNVPMHRWAQSQMFRSLSFLVAKNRPAAQQNDPKEMLVLVSSRRNE